VEELTASLVTQEREISRMRESHKMTVAMLAESAARDAAREADAEKYRRELERMRRENPTVAEYVAVPVPGDLAGMLRDEDAHLRGKGSGVAVGHDGARSRKP
jgi:hypothetical protein